MVVRGFQFLKVFDAGRRSWFAVPLVAIALGGVVARGNAQELPPAQQAGLALPSTGAPSFDSTAQPTSSESYEQAGSNRSFTSAAGPTVETVSGQPVAEQRDSRIFTLEPQYVSAVEFGRVLQRLLMRDDVHVVPDERTNRLLIVASPMPDMDWDRLNKRLHEIKDLVDVEAPQTGVAQQRVQDVASWEKLVRDLQVREKDLQRQLEAVTQSNSQQGLESRMEMENVKKMEFDVQLARIQRMRSQLDLMEAQLYENAGMAMPWLSKPRVPTPVPPTTPVFPEPNLTEHTEPGRGPEEAVPPAPALPPTPAQPPTGYRPVAPKAPDSGLEFRYGDFVPAWGVAGELLRLREMAPDMDLAPVYEEALQRLNAQLEGAHAQFEAARKVRDAVEEQMKTGVASAVDLAKIEAEWVPVGARLNELKVQIKILTDQRDKILQPKSATVPSQDSR